MTQPSSLLRRLLFSYLAFGLGVAMIFPFYAAIFVEWKPGMLPWFVAGCVVAGLSIGVVNYALLNGILLSRLKRVAEIANLISNKDLSQQCNLQSADTIGEIIDSFNAMAANLRELLSATRSLSQSVDGESHNIHGFLGGIGERLDEQRHEAIAIDGVVNQLDTAAAAIAARAQATRERSRTARELAAEGGQSVAATVTEMEKLDGQVGAAATAVDKLRDQSQQINTIVQVIREIAGQTNLLALNAAIEAARAGESGRGFAVVADEVRKLAEKTGKSTEEIGAVIAAIHQDIDQTVQTIAAGTATAASSVTLAREAGRTLDGIIVSFGDVASLIDEIADTARTQENDVGKMRGHVEHFGTLIEAIRTDVATATHRAEDLVGTAEGLHHSVAAYRTR
jgi:methyl-accepting chemotaxis protein